MRGFVWAMFILSSVLSWLRLQKPRSATGKKAETVNHSRRGTRSGLTRHVRRQSSLRLDILDVLKQHPVFELEDLVRVCSAYTWNQVFLEVDRLSRTGEVQLVYRAPGVYTVTLPLRQAA